MNRVGALLALGALAALVAASAFSSVVNNLVRLGVVAACLCFVAGLMILAKQSKAARVVVAGVSLALVVIVGAPVRTDAPTLQAQMAKEVLRYEGVAYVWGGESIHGIDCSGLPRSARRSAATTLAVSNLDPGLLRIAAIDWLVDVPAKGMLAGVGTERLAAADNARSLPKDVMVPGNLVATADGMHMMVVVDEGHLIEADPLPSKVIIAPVDDEKNPWMTTKVVALRFLPP